MDALEVCTVVSAEQKTGLDFEGDNLSLTLYILFFPPPLPPPIQHPSNPPPLFDYLFHSAHIKTRFSPTPLPPLSSPPPSHTQ